MPLPGEILSDAQAFEQILGRLRGEVGKLLELATGAKQRGEFGTSAPFWAMVRMMMPIAESLGDLIYQKDSTSSNLISVLEHEFEAAHTGYRGRAAVIAVLYRHGLTHQDELRCLKTEGRELLWHLSFGLTSDHLRVTSNGAGAWWLHFDLHAFYRDLVAVCESCLARRWGGNVKERYNSWLEHDLDAPKSGASVKQARREISQL